MLPLAKHDGACCGRLSIGKMASFDHKINVFFLPSEIYFSWIFDDDLLHRIDLDLVNNVAFIVLSSSIRATIERFN